MVRCAAKASGRAGRPQRDVYKRQPFYSRQVATLGLRYASGPWVWNLDGYAQTRQFADSANTREESADGALGEIPGSVSYTHLDVYKRQVARRQAWRHGAASCS